MKKDNFLKVDMKSGVQYYSVKKPLFKERFKRKCFQHSLV